MAARHGVDVHSEIASAQPRPSPMDGVARWTEEVDDLADTGNVAEPPKLTGPGCTDLCC